MAASIFNGTAVKLLKDILRFKTGTEIITGNSADPTSSAVNAPVGSMYIRSGTNEVYIKGDSGSSTNWKRIANTSDVQSSNFIANTDRDAETSVGNWAAYADAAAATPVDMTGGSPNTTITRTTTAGEILAGAASFKITKSSGASRQGEGVSVAFTIPPAYQGKSCTVEIPYRVTSGSVTSGDFLAFIYDSTNSVLLTPSSNAIVGTTGTLTCSFTSSVSAGTPASQSYRLGIHIATTTDSAVAISFDDVIVKPGVNYKTEVVTPWQAFTPTYSTVATYDSTITAVTKATSGITVDRGVWRRVGDSMEVILDYNAINTSGGSETAGIFLVPIPGSHLVDTTKVTRVASTFFNTGAANYQGGSTVVGHGMVMNSSVANNSDLTIFAYNTGYFALFATRNNAFWSTTQFGLRNAAGTVSGTFRALVPIQGWSTQDAVVPSQTDYGWTAYTPTLTGFGTPTGVSFYHSRVGDTLKIRGKFTPGTPTATEARASLPNGLTSVAAIATLELAGTAVINVVSDGYASVLREPSVGYVTFGRDTGSASALQKYNGSTWIASGNACSFECEVPIAGWEMNQRAPTLNGSVTSNSVGAERIERATITFSGGTPSISTQSGTWLTSVTDNGGGITNINYAAGTFSTLPTIVAMLENSSGSYACKITSISSTSARIETYDLAGTRADLTFHVIAMGPR